MKTKLFELRDRGTFVPVLCIKVESGNESERYLLRRSGYELPSDLIIMTGLTGGNEKSTYNPHDWGGNRTRHYAHKYIQKHWEELESGQVVDVEFIHGETAAPKISERLE